MTLDVESIETIADVEQLETLLSEPSDELIETMGRLEGDIIVLGVGGKMGPTLARMARRASDAAGVRRRVIGVARFSSAGLPERLEAHGVEPIRCDLIDPDEVARLPDAPNVVFMAGMKFGTTGREAMTWAMNTVMPGMVARRYGGSRILVFSTGNVYPLTPIERGGSCETDTPEPLGEYANSCLGRERVFQYYATELNSPTAILRLNYANEPRYGVLLDLAKKVASGTPIDLSMGYVNVIWQGDAIRMILRAFDHAAVPAAIFNVVGPEHLRVEDLARRMGELLGTPARFTGQPAPDALLSNGSLGIEKLGRPRVDVDRMMQWLVDWMQRGEEQLDKPTHFETRDGKF